MKKIFKKVNQLCKLALSLSLCVMLLVACTSQSESANSTVSTNTAISTDASTDTAVQTMTPHEATQEQKNVITGMRQQAAEGKVITAVDQKFVNTNYMITGLVNSDCVITEDVNNGLLISVPSGNALIQINLVPGIQNYAAAVNLVQAMITANYSQEGTGGSFETSLLGYNATVIPFTANLDDQIVNGFTSVFIANQSLYTLNLLYYSTASTNELELLQKIIPSLQIIKPAAVDNTTKVATYTDPYASYNTYDPYLYYYISGEWSYEDYLSTFNDYYSSTNISCWENLPYSYYSWYDGDYSNYTEEDFAADWNYYDDEDYWSWGWDETDDWSFYDEYADYYSEDYYDDLGNYYDEYSDYGVDYTDSEEFEFSDDLDSTWEDVDLETYDETNYEYDDYYDDYYYGDDSSDY